MEMGRTILWRGKTQNNSMQQVTVFFIYGVH